MTKRQIDGYFKGDAHALTGNSDMTGFLKAELLEGPSQGTLVSIPSAAMKKEQQERLKREREVEQTGFRNLAGH